MAKTRKSKLTDEHVLQIRKEASKFDKTDTTARANMAVTWGISGLYLWQILTGRARKEVAGPLWTTRFRKNGKETVKTTMRKNGKVVDPSVIDSARGSANSMTLTDAVKFIDKVNKEWERFRSNMDNIINHGA